MERENIDYVSGIKESMKEMIDKMDTGSALGMSALKMAYGFVKRCFLETNGES